MKRYRIWRKLLVLTLVLALALTASLQASEDVSEDTGTEEEIIVEDAETGSVTTGTYAAPVDDDPESEDEVLRIDNITQVPTASVPEEVRVGSGAEPDDAGESQTGTGESIVFYLDWNGIDGLFGPCLTCTREIKEGIAPMFTAEDAAVYNLNYMPEKEDELEGMSSDQKWAFLSEKWAAETYNGYKFLGWSTEPKGNTLITSDTPVENGMSFYAHWTKGDESNETFQRVDPEAGTLESIRIEAGAGTSFRSGTLHASKHVKKGDSFTLNLFYTPVRADIRNITWSVAVCNDATPQVIFGSAKAAETVTVSAGGETDVKDKGIHAKAEGSRLTITSTDDQEHVVIVSATAENAEGQEFASPEEAMLSFVHSWNAGEVTKEATCVEKGSVKYQCTTCGEEKTVDIPALEHVYNKNGDLNKGDGKDYTVEALEEPTCTEKGLNLYTYYCLRCGEKRTEEGPVPALGHAWSEVVRTPASCNKDTETITCTRCGMKKVSLVPAYNPELHVWKETYRYHETCMSDTVYEQCEVCRETRMRKEAADNPDRHSYAYESRVVNDCNWSTYTFKCVHGCGSTEVKLKKEDNHSWDDWTVTTKWDKTTGMMERVQTRKCSRCGEEETKNLGSVAAGNAEESVVSAGNNTVATQPVSYSAGNAVAVAVAQAAPSSATASEGKAGWKKSGKKKYYLNEDGKKQTGWQKIDGKKYYFGKDGVMKTGWQTIKGKKYYFGKDGVMRTGKQKIGKKTYNFGKNGVLK